MNKQRPRQFSVLRLLGALTFCAVVLAASTALFGRSPIASMIATIAVVCIGLFIVVSSPKTWLRLATPVVGATVGFVVGLVLYRSPLPGAAFGILAALIVYVCSSMAASERRIQATIFPLLFLTAVAVLPFCLQWRRNIAEYTLDSAGIDVNRIPQNNQRFGKGFLADLMGPYVVPCDTTLRLFDESMLREDPRSSVDSKLNHLARHFPALRDINCIHIQSEQITDEGFAHIATVPGVTNVQLVAKRVTTNGVGCFKDSAAIDTMLLRCPQVDDEIIDVLRQFPSLKDVYLDETMVSDEATKKLADFPALKFITVPRSATDETLSQLRSANKVALRVELAAQ